MLSNNAENVVIPQDIPLIFPDQSHVVYFSTHGYMGWSTGQMHPGDVQDGHVHQTFLSNQSAISHQNSPLGPWDQLVVGDVLKFLKNDDILYQ